MFELWKLGFKVLNDISGFISFIVRLRIIIIIMTLQVLSQFKLSKFYLNIDWLEYDVIRDTNFNIIINNQLIID